MRGIADHVERFVIFPSRINEDRTREVFGELRDCELAGSLIFTDENRTCTVNGINREGFTPVAVSVPLLSTVTVPASVPPLA